MLRFRLGSQIQRNSLYIRAPLKFRLIFQFLFCPKGLSFLRLFPWHPARFNPSSYPTFSPHKIRKERLGTSLGLQGFWDSVENRFLEIGILWHDKTPNLSCDWSHCVTTAKVDFAWKFYPMFQEVVILENYRWNTVPIYLGFPKGAQV